MAHPTVHTFPGPIRIVDRGPKDGPQITTKRLTDEDGTFIGNQISVPPGRRITWEAKAGEGAEKPTYLISVVVEAPAAPKGPTPAPATTSSPVNAALADAQSEPHASSVAPVVERQG